MQFEDLGFNHWFQERLKETQKHEYYLARVTAVSKDNYTIRNEEAEIPAEVTGKLLYGAESSLDLPAVGDWVYVHCFNEKKRDDIWEDMESYNQAIARSSTIGETPKKALDRTAPLRSLTFLPTLPGPAAQDEPSCE